MARNNNSVSSETIIEKPNGKAPTGKVGSFGGLTKKELVGMEKKRIRTK